MYKIIKNSFNETVIIRDNGNGSATSFFEDPANTDYQAYLAWCALGNVADPAEEQV